jgi:hypothetical protein
MSRVDDEAAEIEGYLDRAEQKIRWGRKYSAAIEIARDVRIFKKLGWRDFDSSYFNRCDRDREEPTLICQQATAWALLAAAKCNPKHLRAIASALEAHDNGPELDPDPWQENLFRAYRACVDESGFPPTLADVRKKFQDLFGRDCWRSDYTARKTLRMLGLALDKDKVGRPAIARSKIGNRKRRRRVAS